MVGALVYAVWTMTAVFRSIPESLEEAAWNLGASRLKTLSCYLSEDFQEGARAFVEKRKPVWRGW